MAKDFSLNPDFQANLPRTGHDLSHRKLMTSTCAHLQPVFFTIMNPGETITLGQQTNIRTMPLQQAAMVNFKCHFEYFFVPMQLIFSAFGNAYYHINDNYSSFYDDATGKQKLPLLNWSTASNQIDLSKSTYDSSQFKGSENWSRGIARLMGLLGNNPVAFANGYDRADDSYQPNIFPYQYAAYQAIWQYYYRPDERERFNQRAFNLDMWYDQTYIDSYAAKELLKLHNRPFSEDYFTGLHVSPIVGDKNLDYAAAPLDLAKQWLTRESAESMRFPILSSGSIGSVYEGGIEESSDSVFPSSSVQTKFGFVSQYGGDFSGNANGLDINTANIRAMFANEKLWSITGRAKKHYDDQTLAHFGFKVPHDVKHEISFFGHDVFDINIGEVISTASTETAPLGEIAGKGYGSSKGNNENHKFTAPVHGVVMAIMSIVPDISYSARIKKYACVSSIDDLYTPEYDHLGQQPLFGYEADRLIYDDDWPTSIFGWQYRYSQWKQRFNEVSPAFSLNGSLSSWAIDNWPYNDMIPTELNTAQAFLFSSDIANQIFLPQYDNSTEINLANYLAIQEMYDNDPFVIDMWIDAKLVSTMSAYSLPRLDA